MSGRRIGQRSRRGVDEGERRSHVCQIETPAERAVHARQDDPRIVDFPFLHGQRDLHHRGDEGRRHAVAGDVRHEHAELSRRRHHEIEEVAGDLGHRIIVRRDRQPGHGRRPARQDRLLNLARGLELLADDGHSPFGLKNVPHDDVAKAEHRDEHRDGFGVDRPGQAAVNRLERRDAGEHCRAADHDPAIARPPRPRRIADHGEERMET